MLVSVAEHLLVQLKISFGSLVRAHLLDHGLLLGRGRLAVDLPVLSLLRDKVGDCLPQDWVNLLDNLGLFFVAVGFDKGIHELFWILLRCLYALTH